MSNKDTQPVRYVRLTESGALYRWRYFLAYLYTQATVTAAFFAGGLTEAVFQLMTLSMFAALLGGGVVNSATEKRKDTARASETPP